MEYNYNRLKELLKYGNFSWASRPTIISEVGKYQKHRPNTLELILPYLQDNDRFVRMAVIAQIGLHGSTSHYSLLDSVVGIDPVLSINVRRAKEKIVSRQSKTIKKSSEKGMIRILKVAAEVP